MCKLSIIVPVYNTEKYLKQCLDSLVRQTVSDYEIIIIDDGSTDNSNVILKEYQEKYSFLHVYHQKNHGLFYSRKKGLEYAHGDYIGWVDSDDFVDVDMFRTLYEAAIEQKSDLVYCNYYFYPKKVRTKEKWFRSYSGQRNYRYVERNSQPWNKLVKRELLKKLDIGDLFEKCNDEAYIKVLLGADKPYSINKKLYYYRVGESSMSGTYTNVDHYLQFVEASYNLRKAMKPFTKNNKYWTEYFNYRIIYYLIMAMLVAANVNNKDIYTKCKKQLKEDFPTYKKNPHLIPILNENFGKISSIVIRKGIPSQYIIAKYIAYFALN